MSAAVAPACSCDIEATTNQRDEGVKPTAARCDALDKEDRGLLGIERPGKELHSARDREDWQIVDGMQPIIDANARGLGETRDCGDYHPVIL